ncbi:hypothetical protein ARSEF4850_001445 [Beauveria asiatica]
MCGFVVMYTHTAAADTSSARTESPAAGEGNTWVNAGAMDIGHAFGGHSDSELVLALYSTHDAPGLFRHLRGEFSFVIVDERAHVIKLVAARDRFGIKPLFWTVQQGRALFAAETTAFLGLGWAPEWEVDSIATSGWLAEDRTVFQGVQKLASGHWMEIGPEAALADLRTGPYWDQQYGSNSATDRDGKDDGVSIAQMIEDVCEKLVGAVRVRLRADVPMGLFLSGASYIAARTVKWLSERFGLRVECHMLEIDEQKLADNFEDSVYHTERASHLLPEHHGQVCVVESAAGARDQVRAV